MEKSEKLSVQGKRYILRMFFQLLMQIGIIFMSAGTISIGLQVIIYVVILFGSYLFQIFIIGSYNPEVLNERVRNIRRGTKLWDKILLSFYVLFAFIIMNVFIGLDIRCGWPHFEFHYFYIGFILYLSAVLISTNSLLENKFFESTSRIQSERDQTVVSSGVYSVVRHPGYASIVIWALSIPFLTGAIFTFIPSLIINIIIMIRTSLEDHMLFRELSGYVVYAKKVKYRLIPFIW